MKSYATAFGLNWDTRFLNLAAHIATWSKDPSTKVGCVLVNNKKVIIGMGYNGFPRGVEDSPERWNDRPTKYKFVVHAEANAILNATDDVEGCAAFSTLMPCEGCTKLLIQAGISILVTNKEGIAERGGYEASFKMLEEAGIPVILNAKQPEIQSSIQGTHAGTPRRISGEPSVH